jgi:hypothetical protein
MTKTVTIPISKETCGKIAYGMGLACAWGSVILLTLLMFSIWFDWWDSYADTHGWTALVDITRTIGFMAGIIGNIIVLYIVLGVMHDRKHWVNFQCNCEKTDVVKKE